MLRRWTRRGDGKFGNIPTTVVTDAGKRSFPSKLEADRFCELQMLLKGGEIRDLELQVPFRLEVDGILICKYVADFAYTDKNGKYVVEDTKGVITQDFRRKKRLMEACHGIKVRVLTRKDVGRYVE